MAIFILKICNTLTLIILILMSSASAQDSERYRVKTIFSEKSKIKIPDRYKEQTEEFENLAEVLLREFDEELRILYETNRISRGIVPRLEVDTIHIEGKPAIRAEYSYSVIDTLVYQTDDFSLGQYHVRHSDALIATLFLMRRGIENHLEKYIRPGIEISFTITGSADAVPITGSISYNGEWGDPIIENYQTEFGMRQIIVDSNTGILDNETLAFMRSFAVRDYIDNNIRRLSETNNTFFHIATVSPYIGGEHRRVNIEMIIYDVFESY